MMEEISIVEITQQVTKISPQQEYRQLLQKIYLLAELKSGKTLSVKDMTVIDHTKLNSLYRWWYDEDRFKTLDTIYKIIDETKGFLSRLKEEEPYEQKKTILEALASAKVGIETLHETYKNDTRVKSQASAIIAEIQSITRQYQHQPAIVTKWPCFSAIPGGLVGFSPQLKYKKPSESSNLKLPDKSEVIEDKMPID